MKNQLPLGLLLEGSSTRSAILRLPKLSRELGPIKSSAVRIARRFSNLLQGGYAIEEYEELQSARLILLHVPDKSVARVVAELCESDLLMKRLCFILCETWLTTEVLAPLRERGASVATLVQVPSTQRNWFVLEGQLTACRLMRRFLERLEGRAFEIRVGSKHLFFAADLLTTILPVPLLWAAQQSLRAAGIAGNELSALLEQMAQRMLWDVMKGIRLPFNPVPSDCADASCDRLISVLQGSHPALASLVKDGMANLSLYKPLLTKDHTSAERRPSPERFNVLSQEL